MFPRQVCVWTNAFLLFIEWLWKEGPPFIRHTQIADDKYLFNELWYLYTRHHSSLIWTQIILDQILHFTWQKEQYANQHFTFCLPCREWGNEGIKILLWYLVKNHYKILFIWTIGIFEIAQSVEYSDHAKEKRLYY